MAERYSILQHNTNTFYVVDCPILLVSHALTKDNQNDNIFIQCKFENTLSKTIKALYVHINCFDVTNNPLPDVDSFSYLDIEVKQYQTFGDKTPIVLPDKETRQISIIPTKIVFVDGSTWENNLSKPFELFEISHTPISELGELTEEYRRELHGICLQSDKHKYLPAHKDGYTICGCGKILVDSEKMCPACGVDLEKLFALHNVDKLQAGLEQYKKEQESLNKKREQERNRQNVKRKKVFYVVFTIVIFLIIIIVCFGIAGYKKRQLMDKAASSIAAGYNFTAYITSEGTLIDTYNETTAPNNKLTPEELVGEFKQISADDTSLIALRTDGTTIDNSKTEGWKDSDRDRVKKTEWSNIVSVSDGVNHKVGLVEDGTVVAYGLNDCGQCEVNEWEDIVQVAAGLKFTVGLCSDGTCVATGGNDYGECEVSEWENIKSISAGHSHTVGLKDNGTVVATGFNKNGSCNVSEWTDIVAISAGVSHTVGLRKDGSVVAVGNNDDGQCEVSGWKDIVAVSAGSYHTVGVKKDGTVVAVGDNRFGQCDVTGWDLW